MNTHRFEILRKFSQRGWQAVAALGITHARDIRALNWLVDRGWLEQHPDRYLTDYRVTDAGFEVLAQAGGDVTGSGW